MKKVLWLIVCLMTMVIGFTSCESKQNIKERFNLDVSNISENYYGIVENALKSEENFCYFHSKYDLEWLKFLKTKIHICTDSLIFGEIYIRGKNSFDGGTCSNEHFIYFEKANNRYYYRVDNDDLSLLLMRMDLENNAKDKNNILAKFVTAKGYLNNETDYESFIRTKENYKPSDKKFAIKYLNEKLDIK